MKNNEIKELKKVYIDVSIIKQLLFLTGIQRVVKEVVLQLIKYDDLKLVFLDYDELKRSFITTSASVFLKQLKNGKCEYPQNDSRKVIRPEEIEKDSIFFELDATWMCKMKRSYLYPILKKNGVKIVVHVYDIICITHPQFFDDLLVYKFMDYVGATIQYADKIICNANATKNDLFEVASKLNLPQPNVSVVPLGANFSDCNIDESNIADEIKNAATERPYLLMVGTIEPRKNHKLILDAYDAGLKDMGYNIILAGNPGWKNDEFMKRLETHEDYGKRIFLFTRKPDYVIDYLYKNAAYVAFLSYKEGYGLPIIESLAKGVPVIATDTPINKEIGGDKCIFFEQDNANEMCNMLSQIDDATYTELKDKLKEFSYCTWDESGKAMRDQLISV